jgi:hypothetical protein
MAHAVIVAAARSPIGRAFKGSLRDLRSDNLTATIVRAALDKVPQLDPSDVDDLMLGCGLPGGEAGFNTARMVAVLLGYDHLPFSLIGYRTGVLAPYHDHDRSRSGAPNDGPTSPTKLARTSQAPWWCQTSEPVPGVSTPVQPLYCRPEDPAHPRLASTLSPGSPRA